MDRRTKASVVGFMLIVAGLVPAAPASAACTTPTLTPWDPSNYRLPDGRPGVQYSTTIKATGGSGTYFWQHVGGTFPPGLTYGFLGYGGDSFTISGTPTGVSHQGFTIAVYDAPGGQIDSSCLGQTGNYTLNVPGADMGIGIQWGGPGPPVEGQDVTFELSVFNAGEDEAVNAVLVDQLPTGSQLVSATWTPYGGSPQTCSGGTGTVTCQLGTLSNGAYDNNNRADVLITVKAGPGPVMTNSAEVHSDTYDPEPDNNTSELSILYGEADLSLSMSTNEGSVYSEEPVRHTLTVTNGGSDTAEDVVVTNPIPSNASIDKSSVKWSRGNCFVKNGRLKCQLGQISSSGVATVKFDLIPKDANPDEMKNTAEVTSKTGDPDPSNNKAEVTTRIKASADVRVSIRGSHRSNHVIVDLSVGNGGPDSGLDNTLEVAFSGVGDHLKIESAHILGGKNCKVAGKDGPVTCHWAKLKVHPGITVLIDAIVDLDEDDVLKGTARIHGATHDPKPRNNDATEKVNIPGF